MNEDVIVAIYARLLANTADEGPSLAEVEAVVSKPEKEQGGWRG